MLYPTPIKQTSTIKPWGKDHRQPNNGITFLYQHNLNADEMMKVHNELFLYNRWCYVINASKFKANSTAPKFEGIDYIYMTYSMRPYCVGGLYENLRPLVNPNKAVDEIYIFEDAELAVLWVDNKPYFFDMATMDESEYTELMKDILRFWIVSTTTLHRRDNEHFFEDMGIEQDKTRFLKATK